MKNLVIILISLVSFGAMAIEPPVKKVAVAPPSANLYMAALLESDTYKAQLQQALQSNCKAVIDNFNGTTGTEANYKLKFAKAILGGTSSSEFKYVATVLTHDGNHNDISNASTGFDNCKNQFDADLDKNVKAFYQISW